jgi:4-amino-4-deoxy-L-arabinose transferase-like glycosyltransferase
VALLALLLRAGFVLETQVVDPLRADAAHYACYAANLHEHGTFSLDPGPDPRPDSFRSPGYPAFLLLHRVLFGASRLYDAARWSQVVLDVGTVLLAFALARRLLPWAGALAAALLTALSPHLVAATGYLLTESLTAFALTLGLWALHGVVRGEGRGWVCGGAFGLASLTNESLAPLPFLLVWLAWRRLPPELRSARRGLAVVALTCGAALAAWAARNALVLAPDALRGSSRALQTISHGSYPDFVFRDPRWRYMPYRDDPEQPRYGEDPGHFLRVFAQRVAERPLRYASWYGLEKARHLWGFDGLQATREIYTYPASTSVYDEHAAAEATLTVMRALHWPVVLCALFGLLWRRLRPDAAAGTSSLRLLGACVVYVTCLGVVFAPWPRYVVPLRPVLYVLAVAGALAAAAAVRLRRPRPAIAPA